MESDQRIVAKVVSSTAGKSISSPNAVPITYMFNEDPKSSSGPKLMLDCLQYNLSQSKPWPLKKMKFESSNNVATLKTDGLKLEIPLHLPDNQIFIERIRELKDLAASDHGSGQRPPSYKSSQTSSYFASTNKSQTPTRGAESYSLQMEKKIEPIRSVSASVVHKKIESPMPTRIRPLSSNSPFSSPQKSRNDSSITYSSSPLMNRQRKEQLDSWHNTAPSLTASDEGITTEPITSSSIESMADHVQRRQPNIKSGQLIFETKRTASNLIDEWTSAKQQPLTKQYGKCNSSTEEIRSPLKTVTSLSTQTSKRPFSRDDDIITSTEKALRNKEPRRESSPPKSHSWVSFMKQSASNQKNVVNDAPKDKSDSSIFNSPTKTPEASPLPAFKIQSNKLNFAASSLTAPPRKLFGASDSAMSSKGTLKGGARNLGNSCYMSAIVQALFSLRTFTNDLESPFWSSLLQQQIDEEQAVLEKDRQRTLQLKQTNDNSWIDDGDDFPSSVSVIAVPTPKVTRDVSLYEEFFNIMKTKKKLAGVMKDNRDNAGNSWTTISTIPSDLFKDVLDLRKFKKQIGKVNDIYSGFGQQDAHEFLNDLINRLDSELLERIRRWASTGVANEIDSGIDEEVLKASPGSIAAAPFSAEKQDTSKKTHSSSSLTSTLCVSAAQKVLPTTYQFESVMRMDFRCTSCQYQHEARHEKYRDLSLDLTVPHFLSQLNEKQPGSSQEELRLDDLLKEFMKDEIRDLDCPNCLHGKQVCINKRFVWLAPVLTFQLKRFRYDPQSQSFKKIANPVVFSDEISVKDCGLALDPEHEKVLGAKVDMLHREVGGKLWRNAFPKSSNDIVDKIKEIENTSDKITTMIDPVSSPEGSVEKYKLAAVVRHMGVSLESGHYICDLYEGKDQDGLQLREWRRYNDEKVFPIAKKNVLEEMDTPYILFYNRS